MVSRKYFDFPIAILCVLLPCLSITGTLVNGDVKLCPATEEGQSVTITCPMEYNSEDDINVVFWQKIPNRTRGGPKTVATCENGSCDNKRERLWQASRKEVENDLTIKQTRAANRDDQYRCSVWNYTTTDLRYYPPCKLNIYRLRKNNIKCQIGPAILTRHGKKITAGCVTRHVYPGIECKLTVEFSFSKYKEIIEKIDFNYTDTSIPVNNRNYINVNCSISFNMTSAGDYKISLQIYPRVPEQSHKKKEILIDKYKKINPTPVIETINSTSVILKVLRNICPGITKQPLAFICLGIGFQETPVIRWIVNGNIVQGSPAVKKLNGDLFQSDLALDTVSGGMQITCKAQHRNDTFQHEFHWPDEDELVNSTAHMWHGERLDLCYMHNGNQKSVSDKTLHNDFNYNASEPFLNSKECLIIIVSVAGLLFLIALVIFVRVSLRLKNRHDVNIVAFQSHNANEQAQPPSDQYDSILTQPSPVESPVISSRTVDHLSIGPHDEPVQGTARISSDGLDPSFPEQGIESRNHPGLNDVDIHERGNATTDDAPLIGNPVEKNIGTEGKQSVNGHVIQDVEDKETSLKQTVDEDSSNSLRAPLLTADEQNVNEDGTNSVRENSAKQTVTNKHPDNNRE